MTKKEKYMLKKLFQIKYAKWVCYRELYSADSPFYTEAHAEYSMCSKLMVELGWNEFELYELEKTAPDFNRYLNGGYDTSEFKHDMFKFGYM